jgi:hypothetical protein
MFKKGNSFTRTPDYKSKNVCSVKGIVIIIKLAYLISEFVLSAFPPCPQRETLTEKYS